MNKEIIICINLLKILWITKVNGTSKLRRKIKIQINLNFIKIPLLFFFWLHIIIHCIHISFWAQRVVFIYERKSYAKYWWSKCSYLRLQLAINHWFMLVFIYIYYSARQKKCFFFNFCLILSRVVSCPSSVSHHFWRCNWWAFSNFHRCWVHHGCLL